MGLTGVRLYDETGTPYTLANPLPISATITTANMGIATLTADEPMQVSATQSTNTAANPIFVNVVGASGANTATIDIYNVSATVNTIPATTGLISRTIQNMDGSVTVWISNSNTVSPTFTSSGMELMPHGTFVDEDFTGRLHTIVTTAASAYIKVYEVAAV